MPKITRVHYAIARKKNSCVVHETSSFVRQGEVWNVLSIGGPRRSTREAAQRVDVATRRQQRYLAMDTHTPLGTAEKKERRGSPQPKARKKTDNLEGDRRRRYSS
jgi:hypothetical protein